MAPNKKGPQIPKASIPLRDLGLTYEEALHGIQTAVKYAMEADPNYHGSEPKHLRVGIDSQKAEMLGLVMLLMSKGIITNDEYIEAMRLAANQELAVREDEYGNIIHFR